MSVPSVLGVVGAGTMGAGIAQLGAAAGIETRLHDPVAEALESGLDGARRGLAKFAEKGRLDDLDGAVARLSGAATVGDLAGCELVIEAAPERPELKRDLFASLTEICGPDTILATNTSSIPVTSLAGAAGRPENVVGMHFFNPPPLMRLLEVIAADQTGERALAVARATGEAMGKTVIVAADGPGFLVNRCGRPFYTEALRLLQERVATHDQIDRICRLGGGFRMGPFELMDMVGIDVGLAVAESFTELSFGEPRWKPNPIQARMAAAGRLGRKTGRGYYDYRDGPHRPDDPLVPEGGDAAARDALSERLVSCGTATLASQDPTAVGYVLVPPVAEAGVVELTRTPATPADACRAAEDLATSLGLHHEWVGDAPGLVLGRILAGVVNEAAFAVGEGAGSAADVDAGATLGLNYPKGPVAWGEELGLAEVLATLDGLWAERHEERYRAAPLLRRAVDLGVSLADA
jgi:3-hydroxybutyryl-CoA dehydrogenase